MNSIVRRACACACSGRRWRYCYFSSAASPPPSPPDSTPPPPPRPEEPSNDEVDRIFEANWKDFFATIRKPIRWVTRLEVVREAERAIKNVQDRKYVEVQFREKRIGVKEKEEANQYISSSGLQVMANDPLVGYTLHVDASNKQGIAWVHSGIIRFHGYVCNVFVFPIPKEYLLQSPRSTGSNDAEIVATSLGIQHFRKTVKKECTSVRVVTDNRVAMWVFNGVEYKHRDEPGFEDYERRLVTLIQKTKYIMSVAGIKFQVDWVSSPFNSVADHLCFLCNLKEVDGKVVPEAFDHTIKSPADFKDSRFWQLCDIDRQQKPRVYLPKERDSKKEGGPQR